MHFSIKVVTHAKSVNTITIHVCIGGKTGAALVEFGTTNTYIDVHFSQKTSCEVISNHVTAVKINGGGAYI
jgi:hypothetical protein